MSTPTVPAKRHALTPTESQKAQLDRLSKDPNKPAFIPPPPPEKTVRAPREMMKNVQGSSAGAGSGEFHVYKAGRRREYERLKIFEEQSEKEKRDAEFERQRQEVEAAIEAKTAKNRAKRQKKKEQRGKAKATATPADSAQEAPFKKRRLVDGGRELVFKRPGEESDPEDEAPPDSSEAALARSHEMSETADPSPSKVPEETPRITIHEDD